MKIVKCKLQNLMLECGPKTDELWQMMYRGNRPSYHSITSLYQWSSGSFAEFFTYFKNGDERKRDFILRGNSILLEHYHDPLRNFIDINRYRESKDALGLETAFHIRVEDWLFYLTHSDFVMTDDYYGMCMAILFEKDFAVLLKRDDPDAERYVMLLEQLGLTERLVYEEDDFRRKEYLFRKPVRYRLVTPKLNALRENSMQWLKEALANAQQSSKG